MGRFRGSDADWIRLTEAAGQFALKPQVLLVGRGGFESGTRTRR